MNIFPKIEGQVSDFDVLVEGHLKWNRYFGEGPDAPPRGDPSTCTSVILRGTDTAGKPYALIIDPTTRLTAEAYYFDLNRRTGLRPTAITHCFATHHHADHIIGLAYFPDALWFAGEGADEEIRQADPKAMARIQSIAGEFLPGLSTVFLPGHTMTLHGIAFRYEGKRYLVAGDGIMTRHHFKHETTEFEKDARLAAETIRSIKQSFDFVIPGHDGLVPVSDNLQSILA